MFSAFLSLLLDTYQSFWFCILYIDPKYCWFHLDSIDPFGKLQKIRPTEKSDTLFFTSMNIETLV